MDEEEIKVSKSLLKTLTVDTRTDILKSLGNRPMTASELSRKLNKHVTTISEHLQNLRNSNLVERVERPGRKWVYYRLTKPGKRIFHPRSYRWIFVFAVTFLSFIGGWFIISVDAYPGHWLYGLDRGIERLQLLLTPDNLARAEKHMEYAEERIEEAKTVVEMGKTGYVTNIIKDYEKEMKEAKKEINVAKVRKRNVVPILETLSESSVKHKSMLENLLTKTPRLEEEIYPALNTSIKEHYSAIRELKNITGVSYTPMPIPSKWKSTQPQPLSHE